MRFFNVQQVARPYYFDRNQKTQSQVYNVQAVAPHGQTTRFTYTVPVGRKAYIETGLCYIRRAVAATAALFAEGAITQVVDQGGGTYLASARLVSNVIDRDMQMTANGAGLLNPGNSVSGISSDGSNGGSVDYFLSLKVTEFDA